MGNFAVIDIETNWYDEVISIGIVISNDEDMEVISSQYYVLNPEYKSPSMFSDALMIGFIKNTIVDNRENVISYIKQLLTNYNVTKIFAYNANFDKRHLPEINKFKWYDIMKLAAYKQYNKKITDFDDCWSTGRLKSGYGVAEMIKRLSDDYEYEESHNALFDAIDELEIMRLLEHNINKYNIAEIS